MANFLTRIRLWTSAMCVYGILGRHTRTPHDSSRFFLSIVPMIYFFVQHKVHRIPGGGVCISSMKYPAKYTASPYSLHAIQLLRMGFDFP